MLRCVLVRRAKLGYVRHFVLRFVKSRSAMVSLVGLGICVAVCRVQFRYAGVGWVKLGILSSVEVRSVWI